MTMVERIKKIIEHEGMSTSAFANKIDYNQSNLSKVLRGEREIPANLINKILDNTNVNRQWLLTGEGEMLKAPGASPFAPGTRVPFYKDMPVSAGKAELMELEAEENAVGFINITGVTGKYAFPVIGCSMEPVIHPGDIVVVDELNQWDKIDPDKIYLVFTHDDRMIKHLETDEADTDIIWCVSPNYKRFSLQKTDILRIYKVTFYGRLA